MQKNNFHKASIIKELDDAANKIGMGGKVSPENDPNKYSERMKKRKEIQLKRLKERKNEKGLIIVFTGNGKGKTTAALGMALRTLGHNENIAIIQFIKGGWTPGEIKSLQKFGEKVNFHAFGEGFTWETQDRERDEYLVIKSWEKAQIYLANKKYKLVILDEIIIALKLGYISLDKVKEGILSRPLLTHTVLTGRGASKELIDFADLATEMKLLHHPFKEQGIKAQEGIEF